MKTKLQPQSNLCYGTTAHDITPACSCAHNMHTKTTG